MTTETLTDPHPTDTDDTSRAKNLALLLVAMEELHDAEGSARRSHQAPPRRWNRARHQRLRLSVAAHL
jgi:hypothetical protein